MQYTSSRARRHHARNTKDIRIHYRLHGLLERVERGDRPALNAAVLHGIINSGQAAVTGQSLPTTTTWPKTWSFATWEQFQRWCLNWCRHSRSPSSAPSPTAGIACGAFLHCSRWLFARPGIRPQTAAPITIAPTTLQFSNFRSVLMRSSIVDRWDFFFFFKFKFLKWMRINWFYRDDFISV